jgi:hypothetical protein
MAATTKKAVKKPVAKKHPGDELENDPNAVHDVYSEENLDPAYDENIADDIAFDYDGASEDPGDHETKRKNEK